MNGSTIYKRRDPLINQSTSVFQSIFLYVLISIYICQQLYSNHHFPEKNKVKLHQIICERYFANLIHPKNIFITQWNILFQLLINVCIILLVQYFLGYDVFKNIILDFLMDVLCLNKCVNL